MVKTMVFDLTNGKMQLIHCFYHENAAEMQFAFLIKNHGFYHEMQLKTFEMQLIHACVHACVPARRCFNLNRIN